MFLALNIFKQNLNLVMIMAYFEKVIEFEHSKSISITQILLKMV